MSEEYRGRVFKSGNSVALRLPKGLGIAEGTEVRMVRETQQSFRVEPVEPPKRGIDVSGFWGKAPWLKPLPPDELVKLVTLPKSIGTRLPNSSKRRD